MSDVPPDDLSDLENLLDESASVSSNGDTGGRFMSFAVDDETAPQEESTYEEPIKIGDGTCATCGAPTYRPPGLTRTGRVKRAPKYCDLHNPKLTRERPPEFTIQEVESQLRKMQGELADDVMLFGTLTGPFFPVTGYYVVENADAFTTAVLKLCKNNPRMMRLFHRAAQVAPIYQVARFGAGVGISVQVDQKKHDPHSVAAERLGVSRAYDAVYSNFNSNSSSREQSNLNFTGPPRYATVQ